MSRIDIRQSLEGFPAFTRAFWIWLTGQALARQRSFLHTNPWSDLASRLLKFAAGFFLGARAVLKALPLRVVWLLIGLHLTLKGIRNMALVMIRRCGHDRFTKKGARFVGECLSPLLLWQDEQFLAERRALSTWRTRIARQHFTAGALA